VFLRFIYSNILIKLAQIDLVDVLWIVMNFKTAVAPGERAFVPLVAAAFPFGGRAQGPGLTPVRFFVLDLVLVVASTLLSYMANLSSAADFFFVVCFNLLIW